MMKQGRRPGTDSMSRSAACLMFCAGLLWPSHVTVASALASDEAMDELLTLGEEVYNERCALCHQVDGTGVPGVFPPLVDGAPFEAPASMTRPLEERGFYEDGAIVLGPVEENIDIVVNGIPGTRMAAFGRELTNEEIAAVVTYQRNAWGNDTGDIVAPDRVESFRRQ